MAIEITELVTKFSFLGSTKELSHYNKLLGGATARLSMYVTGLAAATVAVGAFAISTLRVAGAAGHLSRETQIAIETIQELGYVASVSGSSQQALESTLAGLTRTIGVAAQKGNDDFARLGISVRDSNGEIKKADKLLFDVSERFRQLNLSMSERIGFASSLGIDSSLIQLMNRSGKELDELREKARKFGLLSQKQQEKIIDFNDSFTTLKFGVGALKNQIALGLTPAIKELSDELSTWLAKKKDVGIDGFQKDTVIDDFQKATEKATKWAGYLFRALWRLKWVFLSLSVVMAVLKFSKFLIPISLFALLLLVVDDLIVAFRGGKSVIRDFFLEFFEYDITPLLKDIVWFVEEVGVYFAQIPGNLGSAGQWLGNFIFDAVDYLKPAIDETKKLVDSIETLSLDKFDTFYDKYSPTRRLGNSLGNLLGDMFPPKIGPTQTPDKFDTFYDKYSPTRRLGNSLGNLLGDMFPPKIVPVGPVAASVPSSVQNSVNQDIKIDIRTDDPALAGKYVADSMQEQLSTAETHFSRGRGGR